jgi:hypothetical protein
MRRVIALAVFGGMLVLFGSAFAGRGGNKDEVREALQELNDYIGQWNGNGSVPDNKLATWPEKADWSWGFKGKDAWLRVTTPKGKFFRGGEMRYLPDDGVYQLTLRDKDDKAKVFKGKFKNKRLVLDRVDPKTKDTEQIQMNMAGGGIRLVLTYSVMPADRSIFSERFQVAYTKQGESFATAKNKVECIITGGLGTIAVQYNGMTYYVCCSGCRDAFYENPAKAIAAYNKKKKSGE